MNTEISKLRDALEEAQHEADSLSLSIPAPIRDNFFSNCISILTKEPHKAAHCSSCRQWALQLAATALGWEDRNAPRPQTPKERMEALLEQVSIALKFLDGLGDDREAIAAVVEKD